MAEAPALPIDWLLDPGTGVYYDAARFQYVAVAVIRGVPKVVGTCGVELPLDARHEWMCRAWRGLLQVTDNG